MEASNEKKPKPKALRLGGMTRAWLFIMTAVLLVVFGTLAWFNSRPPETGRFGGEAVEQSVSAQVFHFDRWGAISAGRIITPEILTDPQEYDLMDAHFEIPLWPGVSEYLLLNAENITESNRTVFLTLTLSGIRWNPSPLLERVGDDGLNYKQRLADRITVNVLSPDQSADGSGTRFNGAARREFAGDYAAFTEVHYLTGAGSANGVALLDRFPVPAGHTQRIFFNYSMCLTAVYPPIDGPLITVERISLTAGF